jgi:hypothetical protein
MKFYENAKFGKLNNIVKKQKLILLKGPSLTLSKVTMTWLGQHMTI